MRHILLLTLLLTSGSISRAQLSLAKIWQSDSLTVRSPESVLYDSKSNSLYVSSTGSGTVTRLAVDGTVIKRDWVTGLQSNMGSAIFNGLFYTTEPTGVVVIDLEKASAIKHIPIEGIGMLNDVAVDAKGIVYVSDTRTGKVFRIEGDKATLYLENLPGANGLLTVNSDLYVVTSTSVQKVSVDKQITKIGDGFENGLDGIVMIGENEFVLSNYRGILYYLKADGTKQILLDSRANRIMANDISYDSKTKTLFVPSYGTNRITAYKLN